MLGDLHSQVTWADASTTKILAVSVNCVLAAFLASIMAVFGLPAAASATETLLPYGSTFTYKQVGHGELEGFQAPGYPTSDWSQSNAPFGGGTGYDCGSLYEPIHTNWDANTDLLLRHVLSVPAQAYNVTVHMQVDNDAQVWWDGQEISMGVQRHDYCATLDDVGPFPVPQTLLSPSSPHILAVRAIDRGVLTRFDASVDYESCSQSGSSGAIVACIAKLIVANQPEPSWKGGRIPYSWGGGHKRLAGPSKGTCDSSYKGPEPCHADHVVGLDCSGFTRWVYALAFDRDVLGPGNNTHQRTLRSIHFDSQTNPTIGDLVFYGNLRQTHHVGIYIGNDKVIDEPETNRFLRIDRVSAYRNPRFYIYAP